jgi:hypothetical protein
MQKTGRHLATCLMLAFASPRHLHLVGVIPLALALLQGFGLRLSVSFAHLSLHLGLRKHLGLGCRLLLGFGASTCKPHQASVHLLTSHQLSVHTLTSLSYFHTSQLLMLHTATNYMYTISILPNAVHPIQPVN